MKVISTILLALFANISTLFAPDLSTKAIEDKEANVNLVLKLNDVMKEKYNYYPRIDTNIIYMDIDYMYHTIHKMLIVESISKVEVGLDFDSYNALTKKEKMLKAYNEKEGATGILQMRWVMWQHLVNEIKVCNYELSDRWDAHKSFNMFIAFQNYYNPTWSLEKASRDWNGGGDLGLRKKTTLHYYGKVKRYYNKFYEELGI